MLKEYTITITQQDIDSGICQSPRFCAAARAIRRDAKIGGVCISDGRIGYGIDDCAAEAGPLSAKLPKELVTFIETFDYRREAAKPLTFALMLDVEAATGVAAQ